MRDADDILILVRRLRLAVAVVVASFLIGLAPTAATAQADYKIHAGDSLTIQVFGETASQAPFVVAPDGSIVYPLVGRLDVAGKSPAEVSKMMQHALARYILHPSVTVGVVQEGTMDVLVLGNVKTPGKYTLKGGERLTDAIAAAGGLGPTDGPYPEARVSLGTQVIQKVSLQKLLHDGDTSLNSQLTNDSVVYVESPAQIMVRVIGAVDHPGDIEIGENDRLSLAIAKAGNTSGAHADLNNIHVTRVQENGTTQAFTVNLYDELVKGNVNADPVMKKGDIVYVPQAKSGTDGTGLLMSLRRFVFPWW